jgi:NAD(P)-dependent dehydrogenase (short-subunit alcohol dehydrogenase family)
MNVRRVAVITGAGSYVGPELAALLAARGHDLVLGDPLAETVETARAAGVDVLAVDGLGAMRNASDSERLAEAALQRFGRIDAAVIFSGAIVTGSFMRSSIDDLRKAIEGCLETPYHFLKAMLPSMIERRDGQLLVITSASAARATPGAPLYSAARAGATHLVRNVAGEVAKHNVQVNAVGTNFMDFPAFREASRADDPEVLARLQAQVPLGRLGTMSEFAHFCAPYVDGTSRFATGQFTSYSGGWS